MQYGERGQITGAILDGPLAFDSATANMRRRPSIYFDVAGDPYILLAPDLEAGNILAKQLIFLANETAPVLFRVPGSPSS